MKIMIVGLGLIGGSLAKAFSRYTKHEIWGYDTDSESMAMALDEGAVHFKASLTDLPRVDIVIVALPLEGTLDFLKKEIPNMTSKQVLVDTCGVKEPVVEAMKKYGGPSGPLTIGMHPMAGRELYGYSHSLDNLFQGASLVVTPMEDLGHEQYQNIVDTAHQIGFSRVEVTSATQHDKIIAYTSQLAHVVSSAYIKSPTMKQEAGYSAGSFRDMTRVAKLDEEQWAALMMANRYPLIKEIDYLLGALMNYREALDQEDITSLTDLLAEGRKCKEWSNKKSQKN